MGARITIEMDSVKEAAQRIKAASKLFAGVKGVTVRLSASGDWVEYGAEYPFGMTFSVRENNCEAKIVNGKLYLRYKEGWYDPDYPQLGRWTAVKRDEEFYESYPPRIILRLEAV